MKIDEKLSVYKDRKVIIWGASVNGKYAYDVLTRYDVEIVAFVDKDPAKQGTKYLGLDVFSPDWCREMTAQSSEYLVQIGSIYEKEIIPELEKMEIYDYVRYSELRLVSKFLMFQYLNKDKKFYDYYLKEVCNPPNETGHIWVDFFDRSVKSKNIDNILIMCLPPKTGNKSVFYSIQDYSSLNTAVVETWHSSFHINDFLRVTNAPVNKIITAVREPISQNLSELFQMGALLVDMEAYWNDDYRNLLEKVNDLDAGVDTTDCIYLRYMKKNHSNCFIQNFFEKQFKEGLGIDLLQYPFDTEKGYSIIDVNGVEIFIYQLEKLDRIEKELLAFAGIDSDLPLKRLNEGSSKGYNNLYQEVKETITFSKEYFDNCFDNPYIRHFYSESDIHKFREKWESHIE